MPPFVHTATNVHVTPSMDRLAAEAVFRLNPQLSTTSDTKASDAEPIPHPVNQN